MSFYIHVDGVTGTDGPYPSLGSAQERATMTARMRSSRGASASGVIVDSPDPHDASKAKIVSRFRYVGGPFDSVQFDAET